MVCRRWRGGGGGRSGTPRACVSREGSQGGGGSAGTGMTMGNYVLNEVGARGRHGSVRGGGRLLGRALRFGGPVGLGWWLGGGLRLRRRGGARSLTPEGVSYSGYSGGLRLG